MRASFVFSEVITGLRRNVTMTVAMILTAAVSLGMFGGGLLVVRTVDKMKANYLEDVEVIVNLNDQVSANDENCTQELCSSLRASLEDHPAVKSVVYESRKEAFQRFKKLFKQQPQLLELARPKSVPASLHVKLYNPKRAKVIVKEYGGKAGVMSITNQSKMVDKVFGFLNDIRDLAFVVALLMAVAALMLISNTIQLSAFTRRTEVGIMRLVGASRWYTQLPFLLEAVVAGVIGALLSVGGLIGLRYIFLSDIIATLKGIVPPIQLIDILFPVAPILIAMSIAISAITGYLTLRVYVRH